MRGDLKAKLFSHSLSLTLPLSLQTNFCLSFTLHTRLTPLLSVLSSLPSLSLSRYELACIEELTPLPDTTAECDGFRIYCGLLLKMANVSREGGMRVCVCVCVCVFVKLLYLFVHSQCSFVLFVFSGKRDNLSHTHSHILIFPFT